MAVGKAKAMIPITAIPAPASRPATVIGTTSP
jgi:hypothetical protein